MEKYIDFPSEKKQEVLDAINQISHSRIVTRLNLNRNGQTTFYRLSINGNEQDIDLYIDELEANLS
ncbi:hypothetical protein [Aquimarina mytili]|uniref:Uncharacterized protein n=1 Tax=Aquimarina mytili TaxID=874423 RepID=A0A937A235_9FLAO|nr:hypothetical protein [Aquimarina mytili]MBL0686055.1 hypothetical protein [Aquimarina mytili]